MKKLMIVMVLGLFMVSLVSAAEWDNVKKFNKSIGKYGKYEITNWLGLGRKIIDLELINNTVSCSNDCEAITDIMLYGSGDTIVDDVRFYREDDKGKWGETNIRSYNLYYNESSYNVSVNDYKYQCTVIGSFLNETNKTSCGNVIVGSHLESRIIWKEFTLKQKFNAGAYKIKLKGIKKGSWKIDWQIKSNGFWTDEWAAWDSSSLLTKLVANYPMNETSGVVVDMAGNFSGTNIGAVRGEVGLINNSFNFSGSQNWTAGPWANPFEVSACVWMNFSESNINNWIFGRWAGGGGESWLLLFNASGRIEFIIDDAGVGQKAAISVELYNDNAWHQVCGVGNSTHPILYIDNDTEVIVGPPYTQIDTSGTTTKITAGGDVGVFYLGKLDEAAVWNRTLTQAEISTLYNAGVGLFYPFNEGNIFLNSPAANAQNPSEKINFNCTATVQGATIVNMSLYTNETGPWESRNFTTGLSGASETQTWNRTYTSQQAVLWGCQACDSDGDCGFSFENRTVVSEALLDELNLTFNASLSVTENGLYNIHFQSSGASLSSPKLVFNSVENDATLTDNGDGTFNISATRFAKSTDITNSSFNFQVLIDTITRSSSTRNQSILSIGLSNCSVGNSSSYIHIIFKDESDLTDLNATVSASIWNFWIDDSDNPEQFLFTQTVENSSYDFCFIPSNKTLTSDIEFPYASTGYPQRVFRADDILLTNTTTNKTLYLLATADGILTRYAAINSLTGSAISGVEVTVQKDISGVPTTIAQGITDDTGLLTLFLNLNDLHSFTFIKENFAVTTFSIRPSSPDTYQIAMIPSDAGAAVGNGTEIGTGLTYIILPSGIILQQNTTHTFSFNVSRTNAVDNFTMILTANGTTLFSGTNIGNGILSTIINTSSNSSITGTYKIFLSNETIELFKTWTISTIVQGNFSLDAWMEFGNDLTFNSLWWNLFRYIVILSMLLIVAWGFYFIDPFDSAIGSLSASIIIVWLFGTFGWLTINTPLGDGVDNIVIPAIFSILMIAFMLWRYKSQ